MRQQGFTLLEVLIVIAIIGILAGIFGFSYIRNIRIAELREAAIQMASDLRRARSLSQRNSVDYAITWTGTNPKAYLFNGQTRTLPNGVTFSCKPTCANPSITYGAPYGTVGMTGQVLSLKSPASGIDPLEIRTIGITGKVNVVKVTP